MPHAPRPTDHLFPDRVTVLAHRGWSARAPENTLAAFRLAAEAGFGFELDVGLTRDGHAVVLHDDTLDRTTTGYGPLDQTTLAELRTLDAGAWFSPAFAGEPVPLLREVLTELGGRVPIDLEIKSPRRGGPWNTDDLARAVVDLVVDLDLVRQVFVTSFDPWVLAAARKRCPELARGLLWYRPARHDLRGRLEQHLVRGLWFNGLNAPDLLVPQHDLWDAASTRRRQAEGYRLGAWTVNDEDRMRELIGLGVSVLITDHPDRARQVIEATA
jgi:glycerophosphoryl diester phosphodiesterase